jgi:[2Fe-2S] binding domain
MNPYIFLLGCGTRFGSYRVKPAGLRARLPAMRVLHPGQIMSAIGLIQEAGDDPERVREAMSGNLCRCGACRGSLTR